MSYARFGSGSDVYVYDDVGGYIACCGCILGDKWDFHSVPEVVAHMQEHVDAGHRVPEYLLDPETFDDARFVAMCDAFMCRKDTGHDGGHSPHRWNDRFPKSSPASNDYRCPCGAPKDDPVHVVTPKEEK